MPRTTIDIDPTVLRDLKRRQKRDGKTLGHLVSELLAAELARDPGEVEPTPFAWTTLPMRARVDIDDKEAVRRALGDG